MFVITSYSIHYTKLYESTPSYKHTHVEGYDSTVKALVEHLSTPSKPNSKLNVITGMVSPGDIA